MATSPASQARGHITFASGFFARILDIQPFSQKRAKIDTSHMGLADDTSSESGYPDGASMINIPNFLIDNGELVVEIEYNPDSQPPIGHAPETVTVALGDSATQATIQGAGWMSEFTPKAPLNDIMKGTAKITWTGPLTFAAGT
jgi:hypothetical protein